MNLEQFFDRYDEVPNHRGARFADIEVSEWSEGFRFEGLAAVFDEVMVLPDYSESVEHGAFRKVLAGSPNVPMFVEHSLKSDQIPLATTGAGTMRLEEVPQGLKVTADVADTQLGRDLRVSVKRKDIGGMSYGFVAGRGNTQLFKREGRTHRSIKNLKKILDVSPTWDPAYRGTTAEFRSAGMAATIGSPESLQQLLGGDPAQFEDGAVDLGGVSEPVVPDGEQHEGDESGVAEHRSVAARRRAMSIYLLTHGGLHDET